MAKCNRMWPGQTVGIDLGDKASHVCVLDEQGEVLEESKLSTTRKALQARFKSQARLRIVIETGTHANWVRDELSELGHEVLIANARKLRAISQSERKDDRTDAQMLARLGRVDARLLCPVEPRPWQERCERSKLHARAALVEARTQLVNAARGLAKSHGFRLSSCSTASFHKTDVPVELLAFLSPILAALEELSRQIKRLDVQVELLCKQVFPQTALLRQIPGVGPITSLYGLLSIGDPRRFDDVRDVGAYFGLTPRRSQSGKSDPELGITKAGDVRMRTLLVQCAHYILGRYGPDCDLRRFGKRLEARGKKNSKKSAVVATARKLAVLMLALLRNGEVYEPLRNSVKQTQAKCA
jgi:transposase